MKKVIGTVTKVFKDKITPEYRVSLSNGLTINVHHSKLKVKSKNILKVGTHLEIAHKAYKVLWANILSTKQEIEYHASVLRGLEEAREKNNFKTKIKTFCRERKITRLCHFTRTGNLRSILRSGLLGRDRFHEISGDQP